MFNSTESRVCVVTTVQHICPQPVEYLVTFWPGQCVVRRMWLVINYYCPPRVQTSTVLRRTWLIIKVLTKVLKGSMASDVREDSDFEEDSDLDEKED